MSWLFSLFDGGKMAILVATVLAMAAFVWRILAGAKKAGVDQQKAKEAEAHNENLKRIKAAADAGERIRTQPDDPGVPDPYDLDAKR